MSVISFSIIFSHSEGSLFILLSFLCCAKVLSLIRSHSSQVALVVKNLPANAGDARVWAPGDHSCNAHVKCLGGFPGGSDVKKKSTSNAGDPDLIAGSGRYPGERNGNLLQYSCRENSMDRGAWRTTVHRVTKSQTRLTNTFTLHFKYLEPASCFPPS